MNKVLLWFLLSCKRVLKRPFFLLLLLLIPAGMWLFHNEETKGTDKISIALCTEGDSFNERVADELMRSASSFEYYRCGTKEELMDDVMSGRAECGYIFPSGLLKKLENGTHKRAVTVVTAPSTVTAKLASEAVFAGMFRVYGGRLLEGYAGKGEPFQDFQADVAWAELEPLFQEYLENGSTFSFEYGTEDGSVMKTDTAKAAFPVRGIVAIFVFVMGLAAAVTAGEDEQNGLWKGVRSGRKQIYMAAQVAAPVFLSCLSALVCLYVSGNAVGFLRESATLLLYGIFIAFFSWILLRLLKNPLLLSGLIPFFIILSLVACPIFADLSVFIPVLKELRYLLPPAYYLGM